MSNVCGTRPIFELDQSLTQQTDEDLFLSFCSNDGGARNQCYQELYDRHWKELSALVCRRYLKGNRVDAEEIAQQAFYKLFYYLDNPLPASIATEGAFLRLLRFIARNIITDQGRTEHHMFHDDMDVFETRSDKPNLADAMDGYPYSAVLSEFQRQILLLKYEENCTTAEIADRLETTFSTIKSQLAIARRTLREVIMSV